MKYYSEVSKKVFDTIEELEKAEAEIAEKEKEKEELKKVRSERAKEIEEAVKVANDAVTNAENLIAKFVEDYGSYHKTFTNVDKLFPFHSIFDLLF